VNLSRSVDNNFSSDTVLYLTFRLRVHMVGYQYYVIAFVFPVTQGIARLLYIHHAPFLL
jgi:hypothetical protein